MPYGKIEIKNPGQKVYFTEIEIHKYFSKYETQIRKLAKNMRDREATRNRNQIRSGYSNISRNKQGCIAEHFLADLPMNMANPLFLFHLFYLVHNSG